MPRLLILDDEVSIGRLLIRVATRAGWQPEHAMTVAAFQRSFAAQRPDGVMLDLNLGTDDGVEQLRFLHDQSYDGPIVLMSGFDERVLEAARELGVSLGLDVGWTLSKPATLAQMDALIHLIPRQRRGGTIDVKGNGAQPDTEALSAARVDLGLAAGELHLEFQPIVDLRNRTVHVLEALIRWQHPKLGLLMPDSFIPLSEQDPAVMDRITMWVVREASEQSRRLQRAGVPSAMAVNVSARNLRTLDFPDRLVDLVTTLGSTPSALTLEITESATHGDATTAMDILTRLRLKGFRLAMDDFGTGFSSLKALLNSPFSELKIDKSFVANVLTSRDARVIVGSVAHLARAMGLKTVAEGAETASVVEQLTEFGVDSVQGFYVSRPMRGERLSTWLADWAAEPPRATG